MVTIISTHAHTNMRGYRQAPGIVREVQFLSPLLLRWHSSVLWDRKDIEIGNQPYSNDPTTAFINDILKSLHEHTIIEAGYATNRLFLCSQSLLNALPRTIKVRTQ